MKILDMSAGKRNVWVNRLHPDTVFVDKRPEMLPSVVADTYQLPFPDGIFDLIVFDPPHMVHGLKSVMAQYYSALSAPEIRELISKSAIEAHRVSRRDALLAFKWNDHDVRLDHTLVLMEGWEPLFGHNFKRLGRAQNVGRSTTSWVMLRRRDGDGRILRMEKENA